MISASLVLLLAVVVSLLAGVLSYCAQHDVPTAALVGGGAGGGGGGAFHSLLARENSADR